MPTPPTPSLREKIEEIVMECEGYGKQSSIMKEIVEATLTLIQKDREAHGLAMMEAVPDVTGKQKETRSFMGEDHWDDCCGEGEVSGWNAARQALADADRRFREGKV